MATSTIKGNKGFSGTSFNNSVGGYAEQALVNIDSAIGSYNTGVGTVNSGGPVYGYVLAKYNNTYYSGLLIGYNMVRPYFFTRQNTDYYVTTL